MARFSDTAVQDFDVDVTSADEIELTQEQEAELALSLEQADRDEVIPWETALERLRKA